MTLDWDGRIRMDPSSPYAMRRMLAVKDRYDVSFACDTDHDRHGIVTPHDGLLPPNHYLAVCIDYLFRNRPRWRADAAVGKTIVSSAVIDRVARRLSRALYEVPVGFKWFVDGLLLGGVGFAGEESAGATFLRQDGTAWTTDKDGIVPCLLSAEMLARTGRDPAALYRDLTDALGASVADRIDAPATPAQKKRLAGLSAGQIPLTRLGDEPIERVLDRAPGNDAAIGGVKVIGATGWFAARPSGTENIYKIYAESFRDEAALARILADAQKIVDTAIADPC
jgi:phosphoglucomutase